MGRQGEISSPKEKHASDKHGLISDTEVDTAAEFAGGGTEEELDPAEALRVRCVAVDYQVYWSRILDSYLTHQAQD